MSPPSSILRATFDACLMSTVDPLGPVYFMGGWHTLRLRHVNRGSLCCHFRKGEVTATRGLGGSRRGCPKSLDFWWQVAVCWLVLVKLASNKGVPKKWPMGSCLDYNFRMAIGWKPQKGVPQPLLCGELLGYPFAKFHAMRAASQLLPFRSCH